MNTKTVLILIYWGLMFYAVWISPHTSERTFLFLLAFVGFIFSIDNMREGK
jgi:hypothetical protein